MIAIYFLLLWFRFYVQIPNLRIVALKTKDVYFFLCRSPYYAYCSILRCASKFSALRTVFNFSYGVFMELLLAKRQAFRGYCHWKRLVHICLHLNLIVDSLLLLLFLSSWVLYRLRSSSIARRLDLFVKSHWHVPIRHFSG